ncbi:hypothetical protein [Microbacterium sp. SS28]|uniref:hypothetical protein n=1 Tax=Microbacterium sp. SS28 TaxID=2919948 RepID=UPI001FAA5446|nr:hypothetical protein [Microbacterium sp. SS28]
MFGRHDKKDEGEQAAPSPDRVASSDDSGDESEELSEWEQIEIQRRLQLEVQSFEGGMEG